jgi:hypothetical protein
MKTPTISKYGWLLVVIPALIMSAWGLYTVTRWLGLPKFDAVLTSPVLDGGAIFAGYYSLKRAKVGESGFIARLGVITFVATSAFVNSMRGYIYHQPTFAWIFYAMPPVIAMFIYELHMSWERRRALIRTHRKLPDFGTLAWLMFPIKTYQTMRKIVFYRALRILSNAEPEPRFRESETSGQTNDGVSRSLIEFPQGFGEFLPPLEIETPIDISQARTWARLNNYMVGERGSLPLYVLDAYRASLETDEKGEATP